MEPIPVTDDAGDHGDLRDDQRFWRIFCRVVGESLPPGNYAVADLGEWDSLRHIELMFELEEQYDVEIHPEQIVAFYSDTDTILTFLRDQRGPLHG